MVAADPKSVPVQKAEERAVSHLPGSANLQDALGSKRSCTVFRSGVLLGGGYRSIPYQYQSQPNSKITISHWPREYPTETARRRT